MEQNGKTVLAVALGLGLAVVGCVGLGLVVTGLSYFVDKAEEPVDAPVALYGDPGTAEADEGPTEAEFANLLVGALADAGHDDYAYQPSDGTLRGDGGVMALKNLYGEYRATSEEERDAFVQRIVQGLFPAPLPDAYEAARPHLMPTVRDTMYFDLMDLRAPGNQVVRKQVAPELTAALVNDGEASMRFISQDRLTSWGVTVDTAWADALENLAAREGARFERIVEGVYRSPWKDNYDTARILLPGRLKRLRVKGDPVVFLPHRDVLIVTGSQDDDGLLRALDAVEEALELPRATTGRAWRLRGEQWEPFLPEPSSKAYEALKDFSDDARVRDANDQKAALDEKFEAEGTDLVVGTLFRTQSERTGEPFTYCVLTKGVDSLLPRADWVVFIDPDRPGDDQFVGAAKWNDFTKMLGRAVQKASYPGPERWRVRGFPNAKQLKTLAAELP